MKHITVKRIVIIGILLLIACLALMPMRFAFMLSGLEDRGITARSVEGSVWSSTVRDMKIGGLPLGDVDAKLKFLPLFTGKNELVLDRNASALDPALNATIGSRGDVVTVDNANGNISPRGLFAPIPVSAIILENVNGEFDKGTCVSASGTARVNVRQNILGMQLSRGLSGKIACRDGALFIPLAGQSGLENLDITIDRDGRYEAVFKLQGLSPEITGTLGALGFSSSGDTVLLKSSGQF